MKSVQDILRHSMIELLKPVVRFVLRRGIHIQDFEEAAKAAFIEVASQEIEKTGEPVTVSKLSAATGLQRRDIKRLQSPTSEQNKAGDLITRIVGLWQSSSKYKDKRGQPRVLTFKGKSSEFLKLVESVSTDLNPYTVLFELERSGVAKQTEGGVRLIRAGYEPTGDITEGLRLLAEDSNYLHKTLEHNLFVDPAEPQLHAKTFFDNIPASKASLVKKWFLEKGAAFHNEAREFLSKLDRDTNDEKTATNEDSIKAVVGTFGIVEATVEPSTKKLSSKKQANRD